MRAMPTLPKAVPRNLSAELASRSPSTGDKRVMSGASGWGFAADRKFATRMVPVRMMNRSTGELVSMLPDQPAKIAPGLGWASKV